MTFSIDSLTKKLEQVKISNDCFFGDDLSYEEEFLVKNTKKELNKRLKVLKFLITSARGQ